jgi:hypothetical protein
LRNPELAAQQAKTTIVSGSSGSGAKSAATGDSSAVKSDNTLLIYKADGSLQCEKTKGLLPEEMEKQFLDGIKVFSRDKRADGLMHIQICGAPTGKINVFEILASQLTEAETRGFKKFEPR